jgi:uncharacterized membrane protein YgdD (TMEM256/DUF423 family)
MKITGPTAFLGAVSGLSCVAISAFGASMVTDPTSRALIQTGEQWQIMHTMASFAALSFRSWGAATARFAPFFFLIGIVLYCGPLYAVGLGAPPGITAITPVGGVFFMIGWGIMAWAGWGIFRAAQTRNDEGQ